ncbi:MAG: hypothetical protein NZ928_02295 [Endomicrobia bacterium]|nr:hypothetical protein [Endomicrobiia bacterium]MDW8055786.1 carbohydrate binding domain-containing protein [Elusimicrobiota bacterium]
MNKSIIFITMLLTLSLVFGQTKQQTQQNTQPATGIHYSEKFDTITGWKTYKAEGCNIKLSKGQGKDGAGLKVDYDLGDKDWVAFEKTANLKLPENFVWKFALKSTGNENYLEVKFIDKDGSVFGNKMLLSPDGKWQDITLNYDDFSYWWGGDENINDVTRIGFAVSKNVGGSGIVEIDNLEIVELPRKTITKKVSPDVLDDFEDKRGWQVFTAEGAKLLLKNVPGKDGNALAAQYDLTEEEGKWVAWNKRFQLDFTKTKTLKFLVKAEGGNNRLEFKVIDKDGSTFGQKFEDLENKWQEITISVDELEYWWGGDGELQQPEKIGFAISTIDGGKGTIYIDKLQLVK